MTTTLDETVDKIKKTSDKDELYKIDKDMYKYMEETKITDLEDLSWKNDKKNS